MSFKIGGSHSTSSSSFNKASATNSTSTTTPNVPQWASDLTQRVAGQVGDLSHIDPVSLVAPAQPLHWQAAANAQNLTGAPWNYDAALDQTRTVMNAVRPTTEAVSAQPYIGRYLDPYLQQVVDATGADLEANAGRVRAQQDLDLGGAGAFGGSGVALTKSETEGQLARARASSLGALRTQGFETALGAAQQDAARQQSANDLNAQFYGGALDRELAAASQLGGLSSAYESNQRANIATQASMADALRGIDQQQRQAPMATQQQIVAMLSGLPMGMFTGQTTTGSQNTSEQGSEKGKNTSVNAGFEGSPADFGIGKK